MTVPILQINDLSVTFSGRQGKTQALKGVSFSVNKGEVVAVVGGHPAQVTHRETEMAR